VIFIQKLDAVVNCLCLW